MPWKCNVLFHDALLGGSRIQDLAPQPMLVGEGVEKAETGPC